VAGSRRLVVVGGETGSAGTSCPPGVARSESAKLSSGALPGAVRPVAVGGRKADQALASPVASPGPRSRERWRFHRSGASPRAAGR
jgi:hypothetical protein